jgi:hypothetical protein
MHSKAYISGRTARSPSQVVHLLQRVWYPSVINNVHISASLATEALSKPHTRTQAEAAKLEVLKPENPAQVEKGSSLSPPLAMTEEERAKQRANK